MYIFVLIMFHFIAYVYIYFAKSQTSVRVLFRICVNLGNVITFNAINFYSKLALFYCVLFSFILFYFILFYFTVYVKCGTSAFLCSGERETQSCASILVLIYVCVCGHMGVYYLGKLGMQ